VRVEHPQPLLCRLCAVGECDGSMREVPSWCVWNIRSHCCAACVQWVSVMGR
jgi:hypothetical protein